MEMQPNLANITVLALFVPPKLTHPPLAFLDARETVGLCRDCCSVDMPSPASWAWGIALVSTYGMSWSSGTHRPHAAFNTSSPSVGQVLMNKLDSRCTSAHAGIYARLLLMKQHVPASGHTRHSHVPTNDQWYLASDPSTSSCVETRLVLQYKEVLDISTRPHRAFMQGHISESFQPEQQTLEGRLLTAVSTLAGFLCTQKYVCA